MMLISLTSFAMKDQEHVMIEIEWNHSALHSFSFEGAIYPEDYHGLPVLTHQFRDFEIDGFEIINISRTIFNPVEEEQLAQLIPEDSHVINIRKQSDRNDHVSSLTVFPFQHDSVSGAYFRIDYLEIAFKEKSNKSVISNLRKSESPKNSVLSAGEWYKIPVTASGIYKIDYNYLKDAGINPSSINPKKIKLFGNGGGMLPQLNGAERPEDLTENALAVIGESDGSFNQEDFILFYGQGPDHIKVSDEGELVYQKNYY